MYIEKYIARSQKTCHTTNMTLHTLAKTQLLCLVFNEALRIEILEFFLYIESLSSSLHSTDQLPPHLFYFAKLDMFSFSLGALGLSLAVSDGHWNIICIHLIHVWLLYYFHMVIPYLRDLNKKIFLQ